MSKNAKKCFFICPIGDIDSDVRKRSDKIMKHLLNPICSNKGYEVIRADKINSANKISTDIVNHLQIDELAIADLTGHNPNVFYELGYRKAKNMPIIHIAEIGTVIPFDTIDDRTIFYDLTDLDMVEEFKQKLSEIIENLINLEINSCNSLKIKNKDWEEKSYTSLLRNIINEYNCHGKGFVIYAADTVDKKDIEILSTMKCIIVAKYPDGSMKLTPTEYGLKFFNS